MIKQLFNLSKCNQLLQQYINKDFKLQKVFIESDFSFSQSYNYVFYIKNIRKLRLKKGYIYHGNKKISFEGNENYFVLYSNDFIIKDNIVYCYPKEVLKWELFKNEDNYNKIYKQCLEELNLDRYLDLDDAFYDFTEGNMIEIQKCLKFLSTDEEVKLKIQRILNEINDEPRLQQFFVKDVN